MQICLVVHKSDWKQSIFPSECDLGQFLSASTGGHLFSSSIPPSGRDCPLLQVLAGKVVGEEVEGSLPWIVSCLLEGNNYSGLLLRLDPQGGLGEDVGFFGKL